MSKTPAPLEPGFMLLQGNQLEDLRDILSQWIQMHPLMPLENECILVQSNGIAQWLKMALARDNTNGGCGIAAAMQVDLPGRFLWQAYRSLFEDLPEISPYDKAPLTWRLYRLLANQAELVTHLKNLGENPDHLEPLQGFLNQDNDPRRLYQLAANLADLYDQYQVYRADWLEAWAQKEDILITAQRQQKPLKQDDLWQAVIWRLLIEDVRQDTTLGDTKSEWAKSSRAHIHQKSIEACKNFTLDNRPENMPRRVLVFGISSLPRQTLELLHAVAPFTQVLVFASNPCKHYWGDLVEGKELLRQEYKRTAERIIPVNLSPETLHLYGHPLLASWGKQGRDYLHLLDEQDEPDRYRKRLGDLNKSIDIYRDPVEKNNHLLSQLQSDIFNLRPLLERQELSTSIDPDQDQSLQFLIAHSPQREVEILHDQLLVTFEEAQQKGHHLPPREVLVMVPDINVYAPHIQAVFGRYTATGDESDPRFLPFHIADQSQRKQNTLLIALEKILKLPNSRFAVSELMDLLDTPALRQCYGLAEADLPRLSEWIQGANIRWGLNAEQRQDLGLPALEQNTWLFGLRRLLLGFASGSSEAWKDIEPHDEVAGLEAALLGPLAQLLKDLGNSLKTLQHTHTPAQWIEILNELIQRFFVDTSKADNWALTNLDAQLEKLGKHWQFGNMAQQELPLDVVREELLGMLDQPSLTQKFLGGAINFATLMPMRAIPFKQVWLLGMNDGDYPRSVRPADFDLMAKDYRPGDRSRREDDRYLFLEALLSARQKLVISWVGRSIRDNNPRPPSVLIGQLRDHLAAGWKLANYESNKDKQTPGQALLDALTTEHPLQAFSPRYFIQSDTNSDKTNSQLRTFAHEWQRLFQSEPLNTAAVEHLSHWFPENSITIRQLNDFLRCPTDAFFKERLKVYSPKMADTSPDVESFIFNGLEAWALKDQLIQSTFQPQSTDAFAQRLQEAINKLIRRGTLITGALGAHQSAELTQSLPELFEIWHTTSARLHTLQKPLTSLFEVALDGGQGKITLELNSPYLLCNQEQTCYTQIIIQTSDAIKKSSNKSTTYAWRNLTRPWLQHLIAHLLVKQSLTTQLLTPKGSIKFEGLTIEKAQEQLGQLLQFWWQGMQHPLPTALQTGMQWLSSLDKVPGDQALAAQKAADGYKADCVSSDHLAHIYPDFEQMQAQNDFVLWTDTVYSPLYQTIKTEAEA